MVKSELNNQLCNTAAQLPVDGQSHVPGRTEHRLSARIHHPSRLPLPQSPLEFRLKQWTALSIHAPPLSL